MRPASAALHSVRAGLVLGGCFGAAAGAWLLARDPFLAVAQPLVSDGPSALDSFPFADVLAGGCAAALLACAAWVLVTTALLTATSLAAALGPGSATLTAVCSMAQRACPGIARGVLVGMLGAGLGTTMAGPALADPSGTPASPTSTALDGLAVPDRAVGAAATASASRTAALPSPRVVQVHPGDSLWSIASALLPPGADDARIAEAWHRLHHANHSRIGGDPDLILPGTRLVVPDLSAPDRREQP
jgi:hypothetical protein